MNGFDRLLQCSGEWAGRNRVQPSDADSVHESPSHLSIVPVLGGLFVRVDQRWSWDDQAQLGSMLISYLPDDASATIHWIDTWHNGRRSMTLAGQFEPQGKLIAHGSFAVAGAADWGWRIEIELGEITTGGEQLSINMFCINPTSGKDEGWVWSSFSRVAGSGQGDLQEIP